MRRPLLLALALVACEGGGKSTTSATASGSSSEGGTTDDTSAGTSAGTSTVATSTSPSTTSSASTTDQPTSTTSTDPPVCAELSDVECALADHCMSIIGDPLNFPGCVPGPTQLFCNEAVPCDPVIVTVCKDGTDEVYQLQSGCIPPGFSPCESDLGPCGAACLGLDEQACLANPACVAEFGAPHTVQMGMACSDFKNPVFLACDDDHPPCPPSVPTVCPEDQPDTAFDVPSGCIPPGFVTCMDGPLPECQ